MGLTIFCAMFLIFNLNDEILCIRVSVPQNIVMDMNNVMNVGEQPTQRDGCLAIAFNLLNSLTG